MKTINKLTLLILCLLVNVLSAQEVDDILKKYMEVTRSVTALQSDINYAMYKNENGTKAYESYNGIQIRQEETFYQQLDKMEYIQGKDFVVKLNKDQKIMMVEYSSEPILRGVDQVATDKMLGYFNDKKLKDSQTHWEIELSSQEPELSEISKIILHIDKNTYRLSKQILFFDIVSDFAIYENKPEPDMGIPRLEITYSNYLDTIKNSKVLEQDRYFTYNDSKINAAAEFKGFEVIMAN